MWFVATTGCERCGTVIQMTGEYSTTVTAALVFLALVCPNDAAEQGVRLVDLRSANEKCLKTGLLHDILVDKIKVEVVPD